MKLLQLTLKNFKGIRSFTLEPNGRSAQIFGDNETGKTTLADAMSFILVGKDTQDRQPNDFGIKTRNEQGNVKHHLDHTVIATFADPDIELKRVYKEKWTKRNGAAHEEFTGHTTDYYIDGVEVKAGEYQDRINEIMPEETFKMLTNPHYFAAMMDWRERRKILFDMAGDYETDDIVSAYPELERYPELIEDKGENMTRKYLGQRRRDIKKELNEIPARIDELSMQVEEVEGLEDAKAEIERLEGGGASELQVKISEITAQQSELKANHQEKVEEGYSDLRETISDLRDQYSEEKTEAQQVYTEFKDEKTLLADAEDTVEYLQRKIKTVKERKPRDRREPDQTIECPDCGTEIGLGGESDEEYEAYTKQFNAEKAKEQKELQSRLNEARQKVDQIEQRLEDAKSRGTKLKEKAVATKKKLDEATQELNEAKANALSVEDTDEWVDLGQRKASLQEKMEALKADRQSEVDKLTTKIAALNQQISDARKVVNQAEQNAKITKRIAELEARRKEISEQLEQVEADINLMDDFVRARSEYVTGKVNAKFEHVEWRLFKPQINGGVEECCDAIWNGVPYNEGLNNAAQINAGLDIINTLSKHYSNSAPVFIDNRESVTRLIDTDLQVISLIVSEDDPQLRVEYGEEATDTYAVPEGLPDPNELSDQAETEEPEPEPVVSDNGIMEMNFDA